MKKAIFISDWGRRCLSIKTVCMTENGGSFQSGKDKDFLICVFSVQGHPCIILMLALLASDYLLCRCLVLRDDLIICAFTSLESSLVKPLNHLLNRKNKNKKKLGIPNCQVS